MFDPFERMIELTTGKGDLTVNDLGRLERQVVLELCQAAHFPTDTLEFVRKCLILSVNCSCGSWVAVSDPAKNYVSEKTKPSPEQLKDWLKNNPNLFWDFVAEYGISEKTQAVIDEVDSEMDGSGIELSPLMDLQLKY